jgi:hypothetical protein
MTDHRHTAARSRRRTALSVYATTLALFAIVLGSMGLRVAQGQDPALGPATASVAAQPGAHNASSWTAKPLKTSTSGHHGTTQSTKRPARSGHTVVAHHNGNGHEDA